jgi:hypothetical protein
MYPLQAKHLLIDVAPNLIDSEPTGLLLLSTDLQVALEYLNRQGAPRGLQRCGRDSGTRVTPMMKQSLYYPVCRSTTSAVLLSKHSLPRCGCGSGN